ncbi:MAG TPA: nicotinate (nicotinamide) nucleotide adenylyltransferase [Thermoanaerobaculia bacterium]
MRIGIFGGTFDPVHEGHVNPVARAAERFELARVIWIPARLSPLKGAPPTDARHRVAMVALAISGRRDWTLSFDELDREPPSYTVDTLRAMSAQFLRDELWLLMGTDALSGFGRWKDPEEIVRLARIAAFHREPFVGDRLRVPKVAGLENRLEVFDGGSFNISSTDLRVGLARGQSPAGRVPEPVAEYITKHRLYRGVEG